MEILKKLSSATQTLIRDYCGEVDGGSKNQINLCLYLHVSHEASALANISVSDAVCHSSQAKEF